MPVPKDITVSTPDELERVRDWVRSVMRYAQLEGVIVYKLVSQSAGIFEPAQL